MRKQSSSAAPAGLGVFTLIGLALLSAGGPLGTDMYLPSLPKITTDLATTESVTQVTLSAYMLGMGVGQLAFGPLSDARGRKRLLLGGMSVGIVASIACAVASSIGVLIAARFIQGMAGGMGVVLARAIISDRVSGAAAARAFSFMMLIIGVAPVIAPLIGGVIENIAQWRMVFWLLALIAVVQTAVALLIPESLPQHKRSKDGPMHTYRHMGGLVKIVPFVGFTLSFGLGFGVMFSFISGSSVMMQQQLGLSPLQFSWAFAANAVAIVIGNIFNIRLVETFGPSKMQAGAVTLMFCGALGFLLVALVVSPQSAWAVPAVLVCTIFATLGNGINMSNTTALAQQLAQGRAGAGSALLGASQFVVAGVISPLATLGSDHMLTIASLMVVCAIIAVFGSVMARVAQR